MTILGLESWNPYRIFWAMTPAKYAKFIAGARIFIMIGCIVWYLFVLTVLKIGGLETRSVVPVGTYERRLIIQILSLAMECILFKSISQKNRKCVNVWRCMYLLRNLRYFYPISTMPVTHPLAAIFMHRILRSFSIELEQEEKAGLLKPESTPYIIGSLCIVAYLEMYVHFSASIDY